MYLYTILFWWSHVVTYRSVASGRWAFKLFHSSIILEKGRSVRHGSVNLKCLQNSPHVFTEGRSDQGVLRNKPVMVLYVLMFNSMESLSHDCLCVCVTLLMPDVHLFMKYYWIIINIGNLVILSHNSSLKIVWAF